MAQLYGPPSDGSVIPHELEDAIAADLTDDSRPIGRALRAGAPDPLRWQTSRAFDVTARPRRDDVPAITWAETSVTTLTTPVVYRPSITNTGAQVTGWDGQDDPVFRIDPGVYESKGSTNNDAWMVGAMKPGGAAQYAGWPVSVTFVLDGTDVVEFAMQAARADSPVIIEVNGRQVDDVSLQPPATDVGYARTLTLRFPTVAKRVVRISGRHAWGFDEVRAGVGGTITKPTNLARTAAFLGDSFVNGAGSSIDYPNQGAAIQETFAPQLLRMLGYEKRMLAGIGGTGYTTSNPYADRVPLILDRAPDLLLIYGSVNDGTSNTGVQAAAESLLASVATIPQVVVIPPGLPEYTSIDNQLRAATAAAGREFIDWGSFFTGTGKVTAPAGDGNRDYFRMDDGTHPTLDGHRAMARYLFEAVSSVIYP